MPTIQLEQYVPGQYIDKALGEVVEYHKFNKEFEEKQRQFNEKADLESERNSIMSRDITNRKEIADMSEKRQALDDLGMIILGFLLSYGLLRVPLWLDSMD